MLFNSYPFILVFLPLTLFGFFRIARLGRRSAALWLASASLTFYAWWNPALVLLLMASIAANYLLGRAVSRRANSAPGSGLLALAVTGNLLLLGIFKYTNFFIGTLNDLGGLHLALYSIVLPLGISFYTFTQIASLVDSYRGISREYDFVHYVLFVTYFPHLIAGPILHHKEMMPQFESPSIYVPRLEKFSSGLTVFTIGLAKKILLADSFASFASPVFEAAAHGVALPATVAWAGAFAYTFQLYFDFSGYSDMAIGLSRLFGVELPVNFNSPYKASSIIDFWRRWHMTLSRFLRDYLYIPLGGNRHGKARTQVNLMLTMLLGGFWHGASWTFVAWGGVHGAYLLVNHAWRALRGRQAAAGSHAPWLRISATALTFVCVVVAWVLFRSASMSAAASLLRDMFAPVSAIASLGAPASWPHEVLQSLYAFRDFYGNLALSTRVFALLAGVAAIIVWGAPNTQEYMAAGGRFGWKADQWRAALLGILLAVCLTRMVSVSEFLYFQF